LGPASDALQSRLAKPSDGEVGADRVTKDIAEGVVKFAHASSKLLPCFRLVGTQWIALTPLQNMPRNEASRVIWIRSPFLCIPVD
jgi:hypothetical protein